VSSRSNENLARLLSDWVAAAYRHAHAVVVTTLLATLGLGVYAAGHLGVNSDNLAMVDPDVDFMRNQRAFSELFPILDNALIVVIDAETPELARESTDALQARLAALEDRFEDVYVPGGSRFFEDHGLLYRSVDELYEFSDGMARMQPIIAEMERDASLANFSRIVRIGLDSVRAEQGDGDEWLAILERIGGATIAVYREYPVAVSWEQIMLRGSALESATRRVIVLHPLLDFDDLLAARASLRSIRSTATDLGLTPERGVRVRITGNPALNYEEMLGLLWDIGVAGLFCFLLVAVAVFLALRSLPLVIAVIATLLVGLVWTAAFAAAAIGALNIASVAFAILFIGLGVDFGIHLGMRYADLLARGLGHEEALREAARTVGPSLVLCTITTAIGFFVFVPTEYRGVAELGLISGTGMVIILALTLTFLPALLGSGLRPDPQRIVGARLHFRGWSYPRSHARAVRWGAALAGLGAIALLPRVWFEPNVVDMRDPTTESVQAFNDLLDQAGVLSPWFVNAVAADLDEADALAARARELDEVETTLALRDFVPEDQEEKLEILGDLGLMLDAPTSGPPRAAPTLEVQIGALRDLHDFLDADWVESRRTPLTRGMRFLRDQLATFLARIEVDEDPEETLATFEKVLLASLPAQIARVRAAIDTTGIGLEDLPDELRRRMVAPDGRARVQIFPAEDLQERGALERFADAVKRVAPDAVGVSVNLVEFGRITVAAFRQALVSALVLIGLLLLLLWGRLSDAAFALAPLLLAALLTTASVVLLGLSFNFTNVVVIPLLLGIGVDSGVHLVHESRQYTRPEEVDLLSTTTARAVFYSALTTTLSFGSLALSDHRGMQSLGILLTVGMMLTVVCNLVVLPALLDLRRRDPERVEGTPAAREGDRRRPR
jgi:hopanoid biosynthesis associated RND transporter like protein HpnN